MWNPLKRRTWTNGQIRLPLQSTRGSGRTVIGAVGGTASQVHWVSSVIRRTNQYEVKEFIEKLISTVPCRTNSILLVMDQHSSHRAKLVTDYLATLNMQTLLTPPYSSPFNVCEHVWAIFKQRFAKEISRITVQYDFANLERDMELVIREVGRRLTPAILRSNQKYMDLSLRGQLV